MTEPDPYRCRKLESDITDGSKKKKKHPTMIISNYLRWYKNCRHSASVSISRFKVMLRFVNIKEILISFTYVEDLLIHK